MPTVEVGGTGSNTFASARALITNRIDLASEVNPNPVQSPALQVTGKPKQRLWVLSPVNGTVVKIQYSVTQEGGTPEWRDLTGVTVLAANVPAIIEADFPCTFTRAFVQAPVSTAVSNLEYALAAYAG